MDTASRYTEGLRKLLVLVAGNVDQQQGLWATGIRVARLIPLWIMLCRDLVIPLRLLLAGIQ